MPVEANYTDEQARAAMLPEIDVPNRTLLTSGNLYLNWATGVMGNSASGDITIDWDNSRLKSGIVTLVSWGVGLTKKTVLASDLAFTDATYDIGKTGSERPRDFFLSRNTEIGGTANITGAITNGALTASRAVVTNSSKVLTSSATTDTEIGYVSGVTSAIQTQINNLSLGDKAMSWCAQKGYIN